MRYAVIRSRWLILFALSLVARVAAADIVLSPERELVPPTFGAVASSHYAGPPAAACTKTNCLVAWSTSGHIGAARTDLDGTLLDAISLARVTTSARALQISTDGSTFLVAWYDDVAGMKAARVSADGHVRDPGGVVLNLYLGAPRMAYGAGSYLVIEADLGVFANRVTQDGKVLDGNPVQLARSAQDCDVSFDGTNFFVVWTDATATATTVYGERVAPSLSVLDDSPLVLGSTPAENPVKVRVSFDGARHYVVWQRRDDAAGNSTIVGVHVAQDGKVVETSPTELAKLSGGQQLDELTPGPGGFLLSAGGLNSGTDSAVRLSSNGAAMDPAGFIVMSNEDGAPSVASTGKGYLVVGRDAGDETIKGSIVSPDRTVTPIGGPLSIGMDGQAMPVLATDGADVLAIWKEEHGLATGIRGALLSGSDGTASSPSFAVSHTTWQFYLDIDPPALAYGDGAYYAIWLSGSVSGLSEIRGVRLDRQGRNLDGGDLVLASSSHVKQAPSLAYDGERYVAVWTDGSSLHGASVSATGKVVDPGEVQLVGADGGHLVQPRIACVRPECLLVWMDGSSGYDRLWAARLRGAVVSGAAPLAPVTNAHQLNPTIEVVGSQYLIVWSESPDFNGDNYELRGLRLAADGSKVSTSFPGLTDEVARSVTWQTLSHDAPSRWIAWVQAAAMNAPSDLRTSRLGQDGTVLDPGGVLVSSFPNTPQGAVVGLPGDGALFAYTHPPDATNPAGRIYVRRAQVEHADAGVLDAGGHGVIDAASGVPRHDGGPHARIPDARAPSSRGDATSTMPGSRDASPGAGAPDASISAGARDASVDGGTASDSPRARGLEDSSCGCRIVARRERTRDGLALLVLVAAVQRRRRRGPRVGARPRHTE